MFRMHTHLYRVLIQSILCMLLMWGVVHQWLPGDKILDWACRGLWSSEGEKQEKDSNQWTTSTLYVVVQLEKMTIYFKTDRWFYGNLNSVPLRFETDLSATTNPTLNTSPEAGRNGINNNINPIPTGSRSLFDLNTWMISTSRPV